MEIDFNKYTLTELRKFARFLGIPNPTSYNKKQLIKEINNAFIKKPEPKKNKRGRPANLLKLPSTEQTLKVEETKEMFITLLEEFRHSLKDLFMHLIDNSFDELKATIIKLFFEIK